MSESTLFRRWALTTGILLVLVGLIHNAATPVFHAEGSYLLPAPNDLVADAMFVAAGTALVVLGALCIYCRRALGRGEGWAAVIMVASGLYSLLLGVAAIVIMRDNPFACILALVGAAQLMPPLARRWRTVPAGR